MKILMFSTHSMKYIWYSPQKSKYPLFIEVRLFILTVKVCSELQEVFKYMEYFKSLFYIHNLKCNFNKINETTCNSLLPMCIG